MASLPSTMKAVTIPKNGDTSVLEYHTSQPLPTPGEKDVLVKNDYSGINYIDTYFRTGLYPAPHLPLGLGREGGGEIVSVGSSVPASYGLKPGVKVAYLAPEAAYAEYVAMPAMHVFPLPDSVDTKTGAAAILQGLTGITLIRDAYHVQKGDWILVHAAAGGMGLWLCQLLKAVGAHTIGTASSAEKRELAKKAGAEIVLPYPADTEGGDKGFVDQVKHLTPNGEGVAAIFDGVGKATFDIGLELCRRKGSMISFGNASGKVPPLEIARLSAKNLKLMRPTLFNFIATREEFEANCSDIFGMIGDGRVNVHVGEVYPLTEVKKAHEDLESRKTTGKLLLQP